MTIKVMWNDADITNVVTSATWSGSAAQASRKIEINVINSTTDKHHKLPNIKMGDTLKLYGGSKLLFVGRVSSRQRTGADGTAAYTANDYMVHLLRSKGTYIFKKKKAEYIAKKVCSDLKIKVGSIKKTGKTITKMICEEQEYYNIILLAYTKAKKKTGKNYFLTMNGDRFSVIEKGAVLPVILNQSQGITESEYTENIDSMVNKVVIYNSKNKRIGTISNSGWVKAYGIFQDALTVESGNGKQEAKKMLVGIEKTASITGIGDISCTAGYGIRINDTPSGLTGTFWIDNDTHTFENGTHMMTLELAFKNTMETVEDTGSGNTGSSSKATGTSKASTKAENVVQKAKQYVGKVRYVFGASSPDSGRSDCSGFTQHVYKKAAGISIGRTTDAQVRKGTKITKKNLQKGDLVFFKNTYKSGYIYGVSHVGIYAGSGKFVHCSSSGGVKTSNLNASYYASHFLMGRRVV